VEIRDYFEILWRRKWVIVATALITTIVVIVGVLQLPPIYEATTMLRIQTLTVGASDYVQFDIRYTIRIVNTYIEIATSGPVLADLVQRLHLNQPPQIEVHAIEDTELLQIIAQDSEPQVAQQVANALAEILVERRDDLFSRENYILPPEYQNTDQHFVYIVEPAIKPEIPVGPNRVAFTLVGIGLGVLGGGGLAFLFDNLDTKLYDTKTIATVTNLPILGQIPEISSRQLANLLFVVFPYSEIFRYLRTQIISAAQKTNLRTLMITSAQPAEGKSTIVTNLALSLTQVGYNVVLVDTDLRLPTVHAFFNIDATRGLSNFLQGQMSLSEVIQQIHSDFHVIASGVASSTSAELLNSAEMLELLKELSHRYDFVLLDTPAVLAVADPLVLAPKVDGVLLVARRTQIRRQDLEKTLSMLDGVGVNPVGVVVNSAEEEASMHYSHYYRPASQPLEGNARITSNGSYQSRLGTTQHPLVENTEAHEPDPLTEIKGIGPALEKALNELGILTFDQLANQEPYTLAKRLGPFLTANRICRDGWIEQARLKARYVHTTKISTNGRGVATDQVGNSAYQNAPDESSEDE
jgi:capsular exopolysaccharide synthesis family protein